MEENTAMEQVFAEQAASGKAHPMAGAPAGCRHNGYGAPPAAGRMPARRAGDNDEQGTLMLDRMGRILSCGAPVESIFGTSQSRLIGRQISEFIAGLLLGGTSPSYRARYLVYLCGSGEWRQFEAKDADGRPFAIDVNVSQMMASGRDIFLLTVRRATDARLKPV